MKRYSHATLESNSDGRELIEAAILPREKRASRLLGHLLSLLCGMTQIVLVLAAHLFNVRLQALQL